MNAAKIANRKEKLKLVSGYSESGLTSGEFCKQHNLPSHIFYYWLKQVRMKKPAPVVKEVSNFVPIKVVKQEKVKMNSGPVVELVCANGTTLKFYAPVNYAELRSLIK
jgi:transposase-like protein